MQTKIVISFGSVNTVVGVVGEGIVLSEPSIIDGICPVEAGVIVNERMAIKLLIKLVKKVAKTNFLGLRQEVTAVFVVPVGLTNEQKTVFKNVAYASSISKVSFLPSVLAGRLGYSLVQTANDACLVIDIGGGKTDIGIVGRGKLFSGMTISIGGDDMDEAIVEYIEKTKAMKVSTKQARIIKETIGSLYDGDNADLEVSGQDATTHEHTTQIIKATDILKATIVFYKDIANEIKVLLRSTTSDVLELVVQNGALLCGGGSKMSGVAAMMQDALLMNVYDKEGMEFTAVEGALRFV